MSRGGRTENGSGRKRREVRSRSRSPQKGDPKRISGMPSNSVIASENNFRVLHAHTHRGVSAVILTPYDFLWKSWSLRFSGLQRRSKYLEIVAVDAETASVLHSSCKRGDGTERCIWQQWFRLPTVTSGTVGEAAYWASWICSQRMVLAIVQGSVVFSIWRFPMACGTWERVGMQIQWFANQLLYSSSHF